MLYKVSGALTTLEENNKLAYFLATCEVQPTQNEPVIRDFGAVNLYTSKHRDLKRDIVRLRVQIGIFGSLALWWRRRCSPLRARGG
jgi:hypothetical protein